MEDIKAKLKKLGGYLVAMLLTGLLAIVSPLGDKDLSEAVKVIADAGGGSSEAILSIQEDIKTMKVDILIIKQGQLKPEVDLMAFHLAGLTTEVQIRNEVKEWDDKGWGSQPNARDTIRDNLIAKQMLIDRGFDLKLVNYLCTYKL